MPQRKQISWAQLRVGVLVLVSVEVAVGVSVHVAVGVAVADWAHTPASQINPLVQSGSDAQPPPRPHGLQSAPPQSVSVSLPSRYPLEQLTQVEPTHREL